MTAARRLILFDVDGTLVDSQHAILAAMVSAFDAAGLTAPDRGAVLSIVGLSLDRAMARLAPGLDVGGHDRLVLAYKAAFFAQAQDRGAETAPLYPGALDVLRHLQAVPGTLLGVATGKSRRGLDTVLARHGLEGVFVTCQVADDHPSKPDPSMIAAAMAETGAAPAETVMIGDTSFDMQMAAQAGVTGIGVSWGYHPTAQLVPAARVIDRFADLPGALADIAEAAT